MIHGNKSIPIVASLHYASTPTASSHSSMRPFIIHRPALQTGTPCKTWQHTSNPLLAHTVHAHSSLNGFAVYCIYMLDLPSLDTELAYLQIYTVVSCMCDGRGSCISWYHNILRNFGIRQHDENFIYPIISKKKEK